MREEFYLIDESDYSIVFHKRTKKIFKVTKENANSFLKYINEGCADEYKLNVEELGKLKQYERGNGHKSNRLQRLSIIMTQRCNCKCKYCFANEGTYNDEVFESVEEETYESFLQYIYDEYKAGISLIQFFGGEPLLKFSKF